MAYREKKEAGPSHRMRMSEPGLISKIHRQASNQTRFIRILSAPYQIRTRCSGGRYSASPGFTSNAEYHGSKLRTGPLARNCPGECGLVLIRLSSASSRYLP